MPVLISVSEAAAYYGIGRDRLYNLIKSDPDFPNVKIGSRQRVNTLMMPEYLNKVTLEGRTLWFFSFSKVSL